MAWLYQQKQFTPELLTAEEVQRFIKTHTDYLNGAIDTALEEQSLDQISVERLQQSNYVFSGIKTFHELNEAFPQLIDEEGKKIPFNQFLNAVQTVNENYNKYYLKSEYQFAHSSATMAARWKQFEKDGDRYYLQYRTVADKRVRKSHRLLHNITLPFSSKFWDKYFPPNGWNCRCTVVQVRKGKYKLSDEKEAMHLGSQATYGKHQEMFMFNPGKEMTTFPAYNAYTIKSCKTCPYREGRMNLSRKPLPDNDLCAVCKLLNESVLKEQEKQYETVPTEKGILRVHFKHGKGEKAENVKIGSFFANKYGYEIDLLPKKNDEKCADSFNKTLGYEEEYKFNQTPTKNAIDKAIQKAAKQADNIILWFENDIPLNILEYAMADRVRRCKNLQSITIVINKKDHKYMAKDVGEKFKIQQTDFK